MKSTTFVFFLLILAILLWLFIEILIQRSIFKKIKIRIQVNGTRGKSSVTRLIRAGIAEAGHSVLAKTTGTMARIILPNNSERNVIRWGKPSILEQIQILKTAISEKANALVVECMALEPRYQYVSEVKMIRSTVAVITNVRPDHLEIMGPTLRDVTLALASSIPYNAHLFATRNEFPDIFEFACKERNTQLHWIGKEDVDSIPEEMLQTFAYWEHKENLALSLAVCEFLGIKRELAFHGMLKANPDPGALIPLEIDFFGKNLIYLNLMAANDSESTRMLRNVCKERYSKERTAYLLFNCREDRIDRSEQIAKEIASWEEIEAIFLIGKGTKYALNALNLYCKEGTKIFNWESASAEHIFESLLEQVSLQSYVLAVGNIAGIGLELNQYLKNRTLQKI
ncbi:poly-gamma-glutamate synthase PgsB [Leptospira ryugenii]|uniref:Poly-gamma-glutamate synthase PgsB n=1 Tax=Leptospira ryugenii TaxID=1917863 RepID=A0A2P2E0F0_9LEPT|nr:poly-gamma-glutamate synthase PgsB [Leptospira ryugenii]GBF50286.1 poly-gamma-glutamate synthase PgsB [Leptospira ryugenii]